MPIFVRCTGPSSSPARRGSSVRTCSGRSPPFATTSMRVVRRAKNWRLADIGDENIVAVDLNDFAATKNLVEQHRSEDRLRYAWPTAPTRSRKTPALIYQTNIQSIVNLRGTACGTDVLRFHSCRKLVRIRQQQCRASRRTAPASRTVTTPSPSWQWPSTCNTWASIASFPVPTCVCTPSTGRSKIRRGSFRRCCARRLAGQLPPFVDPRTSRDFIHVDDVCAAFVKSATAMRPEIYGESFNIGTGTKTTIADLAELTPAPIRHRGGAAVRHDGRTGVGPARLVRGSAQGEGTSRLGAPRSSLEDGLRTTADWVRRLSDQELAAATKKDPNTPGAKPFGDHRLLQGRAGDPGHAPSA